MEDIYTKLIKYCSDDYIPMHMPGHKRNAGLFSMINPYEFDITEIDGFDNLHNPQTIILESMKKAAQMYESENVYYLVNGSSIGLLIAISAVVHKGDKVLIARNCHKSVYNAIYMNELQPIYIYPQKELQIPEELGIYGRILPHDVEKILEEQTIEEQMKYCGCNKNSKKDRKINSKQKISAIVITSPTYEGIVSDIGEIAKVAHKYGVPLIVDEAHGAHFRFSESFPMSALQLGADIVVQSIHKTLPAFTQTAIMHVNGDIVDCEKIKFYLDMYQSTSPSYILIAGIDRCMSILRERGKELFDVYVKNLKKLREDIDNLHYIKMLNVDDISKIVLYTECKLNGRQLYDILLDRYHIQLEMASERYVIAMTSIGDTDEYYNRFLLALRDIDETICGKDSEKDLIGKRCDLIEAKVVYSPYEATNMEAEKILLENSVDRISAGCICIYPPGIPMVNTGELITHEIVEIIEKAVNTNLQVLGIFNGKEVIVQCLK